MPAPATPPKITELKEKRDFYVTLDWGVSYSKEVFNEPLIGGAFELVFHQIERKTSGSSLHADIGIGYTYNFHESQIRLPIRDTAIWHAYMRIYI